MKLNYPCILALFVVTNWHLTATAEESVVVAAMETKTDVAPRAAHLRLVNLPSLEFGLRAAFRCAGDAESLTLSVADSYETLGKDALADQRSAEVSLRVPALQIALAASNSFCLKDDATSSDELVVPGMATVHASLRCRDEHGLRVHFASAPLQVRLRCDRGQNEDQDPSPDR